MTRPENHYRYSRAGRSRSAGRALRAGFTLVEMLVVIVIIGILAAILLPVLGRARESAYQASCASNLKTLYLSISQYKQDFKRYPSSLAYLLPKDAKLDNTTANVGSPSKADGCDEQTCPNAGGGDYLKQSLPFLCPDDPNDNGDVPRSSYGDVSTGLPASNPVPDSTNMNRYVWNYWGYSHQGVAYARPEDAATDLGADLGKYLATPFPSGTGDPNKWATVQGDPTLGNFRTNPLLNSMSNRAMPNNAVMTHCVYHRQPTSKLSGPELLYANAAGNAPDKDATNPTDGAQSALDLVLRADGSVTKPLVGAWLAPRDGTSNWQKQQFQTQQ